MASGAEKARIQPNAAVLSESSQRVIPIKDRKKKRVRKDIPGEYSWEELKALDERRRSIVLRVDEPFWKTLFHWHGTVILVLVADPLFWLTISIYVVLRILARYQLPDIVAQLTRSTDISVIGGFLSFFMVFWVNQNHSRYFSLYNESMACKARIFDAASLAASYLPKPQATRLIRYMNAAHAAGYCGLSNVYSKNNFFVELNDQCSLLTDQEMARMDQCDVDRGGSCARELIAWCLADIDRARKDGVLDVPLANSLNAQVLALRTSIGNLYNSVHLPVPFFYVHFICLLTTLYLPLFAITTAIKAGTGKGNSYWTADVVSGLVVTLQAIFVIGLRIMGQRMSDPYGDDLVDFSVVTFVDSVWIDSNRILKTQFPDPVDALTEEMLLQNAKPIGDAWDDDTKKTNTTAGDVETPNTKGTEETHTSTPESPDHEPEE